jgi:hypothetical protein
MTILFTPVGAGVAPARIIAGGREGRPYAGASV